MAGGKVVNMDVVMHAVGRTRLDRNVQLNLKVVPLPEKPGVPNGAWGWCVVETDEHGHEAIVVGGARPSAAEAAAVGAEVLQVEIAMRKLPNAVDLDLISKVAAASAKGR